MRPALSRFDLSPAAVGKGGNEIRKSSRRSLTPRERYVTDVFRRFANLQRVFERIGHASHLIARSPRTMASARHPLNVNDWTDYHFQASTASMHSVLDCCLLLTSEVYRLRVPPRLCNENVVSEKYVVAGSNGQRRCAAWRGRWELHRARRNRVLHRGDAADFGELTESESLMDLRTFTFVQSRGEFLHIAAEVRLLWRHELRSVRPKLDEASRAALSDTTLLMTALEHPFTLRAKALGREERTADNSDSGQPAQTGLKIFSSDRPVGNFLPISAGTNRNAPQCVTTRQ